MSSEKKGWTVQVFADGDWNYQQSSRSLERAEKLAAMFRKGSDRLGKGMPARVVEGWRVGRDKGQAGR